MQRIELGRVTVTEPSMAQVQGLAGLRPGWEPEQKYPDPGSEC